MFCKEEELLTISVPALKPPKLAVVPNKLVVETTAEANRFVVVTDTPVAIVHVTPWSDVLPMTVRVEVTVVEAETRPPYKETVDVAVAPRAVTVARVSLSASK